jgi:subtilisin family serine protease
MNSYKTLPFCIARCAPWFGALLLVLLMGASDARIMAQTIAEAPPTPSGKYHPSRILIQPRNGSGLRRLEEFHAGLGAQVLRRFPRMSNIQVVRVGGNITVQEWITIYMRSGLVEFAEPDFLLQLASEPNDPRYLDGSLWHLHNTGQNFGVADADIDGPEAWATLHDAGNIIVAIVDTGVRYTHEDLAANMWVNPGEIADGKDSDGNGYVDDIHGINAAANNGNPIDILGHGTQVAGLVGAVGNNGKGGTGVAWNVQLMALRFFDDSGNGYLSDAVECFDYARANGAHIINASFGSPTYSSTFYTAINHCRAAGIIVVAAAGNDAQNTDSTPFYPASYDLDNIVALAATTRTDALGSYSNYGATTVDFGAPGSDLYTTYISSDSSYVRNSGTSFAAPVTAGAFALVKARYPTDSYLQLIDRVLTTVDPLPSLSGKSLTGGRLNLANALGPPLQAAFSATAFLGELPLTVEFTDESFGEIISWTWDFGDGATSTLSSPSHTFTRAGDFVVRLVVANGEGRTSEAIATIEVVANYQVQPVTFQWIDPSGMPTLSLTANGVSPAQSLPFTFRYYDQSHNAIYVSANGMVAFAADGLNQFSNVDLPNSALPNAMLCPWWDDLNPEGGGSIHVGVTGTAPNRRFVVSWVGIPHRNPGKKSSFTFQAVLEEATQRIVFQYLNVDAGHSTGAGKSATIGVENHGGTVAARYSYNGSTLLQNNQAIAFVPALAPSLSVTPADAFISTGPTGGPFHPGSQSYTVSNTGTDAFGWQVAATVDWLSVTPSSGTIVPGDSVVVSVSLNSTANLLPAGVYSDSISFANLSNGNGNTSRAVTLTIDPPPGVLTVTPAEGWASAGVVGGPFSPDAQTFNLSNSGGTAIDWTGGKTVEWISLSATGGNLAPGATVAVTISLNTAANSLPAGSYSDTVHFVNASNGNGDTTRAVILTIDPLPGMLVVTPVEGLTSSGTVGGPFSPDTQTFTLSNSGGTAIDWTAGKNASWLSLSATSGSLAPGANVTVAVALNSAANSLPAGSYGDTVSFANTSNGNGDTTRAVILTIDPLSGLLIVTPDEGLTSSGTEGGPFSPDTQTFTLSNSGGTAIDWTAGKNASWLSLSATSGNLAPGASVTVAVALNSAANELAAGSYSDTVRFANASDSNGDTTRAVTLTINPLPGMLVVTPDEGLTSSGTVGGPFSPDTQTFTISNSGDTAIDWTASKTADWLSLSANSGSLVPGASVTVTVSINQAANDLGAGSYSDAIQFVNLGDSNGVAIRAVSLSIDPAPGVLGLVTTAAFQPGGFAGGPFDPDQEVYSLVNNGGTAVDWSASSDADWLEASPSNGTLEPGEAVSITLQLGAIAADLDVGLHEGSTTFMNSLDPTETLGIPVHLEVFRRAWLLVEKLTEEPDTFLITVSGHPGHQYAIETSQDFHQWTSIHVDTLDSSGVYEYRYLHAQESAGGFRMFRVIWIP